MAINTIELVKNKNYGFQLTAPDLYADILTLDLVTGVCTSSYFDSPELAQFRRTALELFTIVSPGERVAGALNLLNRLVAVAAADDATVTRSALVVGDLATLRITVDANPGSFVAHVPFSGDGALAWAGGNDGGGGGGGVAAVSATFPITSTGGAAPDIGITIDSAVTDSLEVLPSGLAVKVDTGAGLQSAVGNGLQVKPGLAEGIAFNGSGEVVVQADSSYFDFSTGPGQLTPLDTGVAAATYGDASNVAQVQVDAKGRVLSAVNVPISFPAVSSVALENNVYVAQNGSDVTGDGTLSKPFATIGAAMASITTASATNRFAIVLAAGEYTEAGSLVLKPDVFIVGEGWENTKIAASDVSLDASFSGAATPFSGFYNVAIDAPVDVDFIVAGSSDGRFNAVNTRFNDALVVTSAADTNIIGIVRCVTGVGISAAFDGGDVYSFGTLYQGAVAIGESAAAYTTFYSASDSFNGDVSATNGGGTAPGDFVLSFAGSSLGYAAPALNTRASATFTGNIEVRATSNFVPEATQIALAGGASLTPWSDALGVGYAPANPGDWLSVPSVVNTALDELASRIAAATSATLQDAYDNSSNPAIVLLANAKNLEVAPDVGAVAAISLEASDDSSFSVAEADLTLETTGAVQTTVTLAAGGDFNSLISVSSTGYVNIDAGVGGAITLGQNGSNANIVIGGNTTGDISVGAGAQNPNLFLGGQAVSITSAGAGNDLIIATGGALQINGSTGSPAEVLTSQGAGVPPVWAALPASLVNWTEGTTTYSGRVINDFTALNAATDVDAALVAKGNGATVAQIADGTAAGGDNRGQYATDFQKSRVAAAEVASGERSVIVGGTGNKATATHAVAVGGNGNTASGVQSVVVGGANGQATNTSTFIGAGSACVASGVRASVVGGLSNEASGNRASVLNGANNIASGSDASVLNGVSNTADAYGQAVSGLYTWVFPGSSGTTYVATDPLFVVGNGTSGAARSNALALLKDGSMGLGLVQSKPADRLHVAGNVRETGALVQDGFTSGAAITAGQVCYLAADGKVYPAQANAAATSSVVGIAVETVGAADLNIALATFNKTGGFGGLTTGTEYFLSATVAGAVVDYTTLSATSGAEIVSLGYARSATEIQLNLQRRGVTP